MHYVINILKMIFIALLAIIGVIVLVATIFLYTSPEFGGNHTKERLAKYEKAENFKGGKFFNTKETKMEMGFSKLMSILKDYINGIPNSVPDFKLPVQQLDAEEVAAPDSVMKLTWFGHSAFLLEVGGKNILIDPMFGPVPAPHPKLGRSRFNETLPISIEDLPTIDAVIISHDHYDHLDYGSIKKLKDKVNKFYVPMGVGAHLEAWGVEEVEELVWWQKVAHEDLKFIFAPSRHFSGRGLTDRFSTLWGSWIIESEDKKIYYSGDSGYDSHFKEIGEKYGPFDFAMMECGQYDQRWNEIHMFPEETAQAAVDVKAKVMMPIHWGSFMLALHSWTDPVERVTKKAAELGIEITTPQIGETMIIGHGNYPKAEWWSKKFNN